MNIPVDQDGSDLYGAGQDRAGMVGAADRKAVDVDREARADKDRPGSESDFSPAPGASVAADETTTRTGHLVTVRSPELPPLVVNTILGLTIAVFLLQLAGQSLLGGDFALALGAKINDAIQGGQIWRLLTPALLHGSVLHIAFNMMALRSLGSSLERHYGHGRFLALYLLGTFGGNVLSFLLSDGVSVGASTAIFGLFAAEAVFLYVNGKLFGPAAREALRQMGWLLAINLLISLSPGIDMWGHLGGLLAGGGFALLAGPRLEVVGVYPDMWLRDGQASGRVRKAGAVVFAVFALLAGWGMR